MNALTPRHNLPPRDYERFVGRQPELEQLRRLLLPYPKSRYHLVTIDGIGGIGKSALAIETAWLLVESHTSLAEAERFEAIVWVSAKSTYLTPEGILERRQGFDGLADLFAAIADVLDFPAISRARPDTQRAVVEQALNEQRTLLVLDNLETVDDEELYAFLRDLPDPTKALMTTRHRVDVAFPLRLTGLPELDALALINQECTRKAVATTDGERAELWTRTGGVPLAITWSIGLVSSGTATEDVLRKLSQGQTDIAEFCFAESVARIRERDAYRLLLALALFASDANRTSLGEVAGLGQDEFGRDRGLEELLRLSLVNKEGDRFSLLPLTRVFTNRELSQNLEWTRSAKVRLLDATYKFATIDVEGKIDWDSADQLEREIANIRAVFDDLMLEIRYAPDEKGDLKVSEGSKPQAEQFLMLNRALVWMTRIRGYWSDCERFCLAGITVAQALGDPLRVAFRYNDLSSIFLNRSDFKQAAHWAELARTAFQAIGHVKAAIHSQRQVGVAKLLDGKVEEAESLITQAYDAYLQFGGGSSLVSHYGALGRLYEAKQEFETAAIWYGRSADLSRERNNIQHLASDLFFLGRLRRQLQQSTEARQAIEESKALALECGRVETTARANLELAHLFGLQGATTFAVEYAVQAISTFRRLGMKREQAEAENLLRQLGEQP